jgi:rhodanese-related sulfurtransferase
MSNKQVCASCLDFSIDEIVKSKEDRKPSWLIKTDHVSKFINNTVYFKNRMPDKYDVVLKVNIGQEQSGKKILYWAADKKATNNLKIEDALKAYNNFKNSGVASVSKKGDVVIKFRCPQVYRTRQTLKHNPKTYFRHLHFVISDIRKKEWEPEIYTKIVVCKYDFNKTIEMLKSNRCIILNTLPCEYYAKDHIPGSYNLPHTNIHKMSQLKITKWIKELVSLNYPLLDGLLKNKIIHIRELPIITYCASKKCSSSKTALEELMKKGFVNVNEYEGGMYDYRKNIMRKR